MDCIYIFVSLEINNMNKLEQDRQCTFNVTLWRVRVTTVAVEKQ